MLVPDSDSSRPQSLEEPARTRAPQATSAHISHDAPSTPPSPNCLIFLFWSPLEYLNTLFLSLSVCFCLFMSAFVRFCLFLSVSVCFCPIISVSVSFGPFQSQVVLNIPKVFKNIIGNFLNITVFVLIMTEICPKPDWT